MPGGIDLSKLYFLRYSSAQYDLRLRVGHNDINNGAWLGDIIIEDQFIGATTHVETV